MPNRMGFRAIALIVGFIIVILLAGALAISAMSRPPAATATPTATITLAPNQGVSSSPTNQPPAGTANPPSSGQVAPTATATPTLPPPTATLTLQATSGITPTATTNVVVTVQLGGNTALGPFLVDVNGMTLYTFSQDTTTTSACTGACATTWPPLTVAPGTQPEAGEGLSGQLATITRADGALQVTYNGHPLYRYAQDTAPGDANGHGIDNRWFVAAP
jgi:predicted lipoprotein with Yx(FWY)xxD motif